MRVTHRLNYTILLLLAVRLKFKKKKMGIPERFEKINVILMVSYKAKT